MTKLKCFSKMAHGLVSAAVLARHSHWEVPWAMGGERRYDLLASDIIRLGDPCLFFLWGYVKTALHIFTGQAANLVELKQWITEAVQTVHGKIQR